MKINHFRISKYNPNYRIDGIYTKNEWTSIFDVGKIFENHIFTIDEYMATEYKYINCYNDIIANANIKFLRVCQLEKNIGTDWENNQLLRFDLIKKFISQCLQEKCWGKLESRNFYIHFGYDYYTYLGTTLHEDVINQICDKYGLYCEKFKSPYAKKQ